MEHANKYSSASVSSESVAEIKQVAQSSLTSATIENELRGLNFATLVSAGGMDFSERYLSNYMGEKKSKGVLNVGWSGVENSLSTTLAGFLIFG